MAASAISRRLTDQSDKNFCFGCCDFKKAQDSELLRGYSAYDPVADALSWSNTGSTLKTFGLRFPCGSPSFDSNRSRTTAGLANWVTVNLSPFASRVSRRALNVSRLAI
jgi:hypothetical protein